MWTRWRRGRSPAGASSSRLLGDPMELFSRLSYSNAWFRAVAHQPLIIERVPQSLRGRLENRYFTPDVVSIGPYHHGADHLVEMQKVKEAVAYEFCNSAQPVRQIDQDQADTEGAVEKFVAEVLPLVAEAKLCYAENFELVMSDNEFANMMVVDGCFLLAVMAILTDDYRREHSWWTHGRMLQIMKDILLAENQIPWAVLMALMQVLDVKVDEFVAKILSYFDVNRRLVMLDGVTVTPWDEMNVAHLLDLIHQRHTGYVRPCDDGLPRPSNQRHLASVRPRPYAQGRRRPAASAPRRPPTGGCPPQRRPPVLQQYNYARPFAPLASAVELTEAGIHIHASRTCRATDVKVEGPAAINPFAIGQLALPQLDLTWLPRCWLMNMVAMECMMGPLEQGGVSSYFAILGSLIRAERDVEELRSRRILSITMSDRGTVEFFEGLLDTLPRQDLYHRTLEGIVGLRSRRSIRSSIHAFFYRNKKIILTMAPLLSLLVAIAGIAFNISRKHK
ncbi:unnamed protein product [Urochloa humidicola]